MNCQMMIGHMQAAFDGSGMPEGRPADFATQFPGRPHTGMVYTPPTFSDHIAVSLLLRDDGCNLPGARIKT